MLPRATCNYPRLAGGGERPVGRATREPPLHLGRVDAEERPADPAIARLELRVLNILGEIGGLREEVIDAKAAGEAFLDRPGGGIVAGGEKGERRTGAIGHEISERKAAAPAGVELLLEEADGVAGSLRREYGERGTHEEVPRPVVALAQAGSGEGRRARPIALLHNLTDQSFQARMTEQDAQGEEDGPVLEHRGARRRSLAGPGESHLDGGPEALLATGQARSRVEQALDMRLHREPHGLVRSLPPDEAGQQARW